MNDLNQYTCTGRLGADPDSRTFASGDPVVNLRVAVSENWRDSQSGEKREKTLWVNVKITNKGLCKVASDYLKKGSRVGLSGKLETETWDKDGVTQYKTVLALGPFNASLVMLDTKSDAPAQQSSSYPKDKASRQIPPAFEGGGGSDDDIPFGWVGRV